jgi:hypothetical protein
MVYSLDVRVSSSSDIGLLLSAFSPDLLRKLTVLMDQILRVDTEYRGECMTTWSLPAFRSDHLVREM